jgi:hypothetical protein
MFNKDSKKCGVYFFQIQQSSPEGFRDSSNAATPAEEAKRMTLKG